MQRSLPRVQGGGMGYPQLGYDQMGYGAGGQYAMMPGYNGYMNPYAYDYYGHPAAYMYPHAQH